MIVGAGWLSAAMLRAVVRSVAALDAHRDDPRPFWAKPGATPW